MGLANALHQDADCSGLIGVNVHGSAARLELCRTLNKRSMTPCGKPKSTTMRGSCLKHTVPEAIAEAAQKAIACEKEGKVELAKAWRHVEDALKLMRGPHQS